MLLDQQICSFLFNLQFTAALPPDFDVLSPFEKEETKSAAAAFYRKFYHDTQRRFCIVGINPGRFGAGITGVPFTDPIRLERACGITNTWLKKQELSSVFIYEMIEAFGGVQAFYHSFYITAISPLGFIKGGKNINYYDNKQLQESVIPFAVDCFRTQLNWGLQHQVAFCLGEGKNYAFFSKLNNEYHWFESIIPLPHPRFIMQYKLKTKQAYINKYLEAFSTLKKVAQ